MSFRRCRVSPGQTCLSSCLSISGFYVVDGDMSAYVGFGVNNQQDTNFLSILSSPWNFISQSDFKDQK